MCPPRTGTPRCRQATTRLLQTHTKNTPPDSHHQRKHRYVSYKPPTQGARKYHITAAPPSERNRTINPPSRSPAQRPGQPHCHSIDTSRQAALRQTQRSSNRGWHRPLPSPLLRCRHLLPQTSQRRRLPLVLGHHHAPRPVQRQRNGAAWLLSP